MIRLGAVMLFAAACSATAEDECGEFAAAFCRRLDRCTNGFRITNSFGTADNCRRRYTATCIAENVKPSDVSIGPSALAICAKAIDAQSCSDYFAGLVVAECVPPAGSEVNGYPCISGAQCQSSYCRPVFYSVCGLCENFPQLGDPCSVETLGYNGLVCIGGKWNTQSDAGAACQSSSQCAGDLICLLRPNATQPVCTPVADQGASCDLTSDAGFPCRGSLGLHCDQATLTCVTAPIVPVGYACEALAQTYAYCEASTCIATAPSGPPGVCTAFVKDGDPCDPIGYGPRCETPAICTSDGVCTLPDATKCL
jgi:hypothetical protein